MSVEKVLKDKNCYLCGTCISICNFNAIRYKYNSKNGFYEILYNDKICTSCGLCDKVCPSINQYNNSEFLGKYIESFLAYSSNEFVRKEATSGGVISTIIIGLITSDYIDEAFILKGDIEMPNMINFIKISKKNINEIKDKPREFASRYVSFPTNVFLKEMKEDKRYLIVGTPCQIQGVNLYLKLKKRLQIVTLGIACSGAISFKLTESTIKYYKCNKNEIKMFYYRGNGWPGYNTLVKLNGEQYSEKHIKSYFNLLFSSKVFTNYACRNCKDHIAENADISFFDFWNNNELHSENLGKTGVIIRTEKGEKCINELMKLGFIIKDRILTEDEIIESQKNVLQAKKSPAHRKMMVLYHKICQFIFDCKLYNYLPTKCYKLLLKIYQKIII